MKIPFDIKYRPQIESGEYKVETRSGKTARIICWDRIGTQLVVLIGKDEDVLTYNPDGTTGQQMQLPSDLFIITPEEEMTEFEKAVGLVFTDAQLIPRDKDGIANIHDINEFIKKKAAELLALAKKELCNGCNANLEGYIKGQQDAKRQYDESVAYHFPIMPQRPLCYEPGGTCTNPHMDCINCPKKTTGGVFSTSSGTSTSKAEG